MVLALVAALLAGGCGESADGGQAEQAAGAHPFAVDSVPDGYRLAAAGSGTGVQEWDAEMGSDEPYTALRVAGRTVVASIVAWDPGESAVEWASVSGDPSPERFDLDGAAAAFGRGTDGRWNDLVVEVGPSEALRVSADGAARDQLVDIAGHLEVTGARDVAPVAVDVPGEWEVLGSVSTDAAIAMRAGTAASSNEVPGPPSGYGLGWIDTEPLEHEGEQGSLSVSVLPGDRAGLDAIAANLRPGYDLEVTDVRVEGRRGVVVEPAAQYSDVARRVLVTTTDSGAVLVVVADGARVTSADELVALAGSVRRVDGAEWEQLVVEAFGGPGLQPDPGEVEIARGEVDGVGWLLQTRTYQLPPGTEGSTGPDTFGPVGPTSVQVDECLKLSTRVRACAEPRLGGNDGSFYSWSSSSAERTGVEFPEFALVTSSQVAARSIRLRVDGAVAEAPMFEVPGGSWETARAGVVLTDLPEDAAIPVCSPDPPPAPDIVTVARIDLLDAGGAALGCAGI